MDCFHCPHSEAIIRGDYADCPWKDTPCFGCDAGDGGLRPLRESGGFEEACVVDGGPGPADLVAEAEVSDGYPLSVLASALDAVLRLSPCDFEILCMRRHRCSWSEVALVVGQTVEACQMRMTRLIGREPVLAELVPTLKGKRLRRERRGG